MNYKIVCSLDFPLKTHERSKILSEPYRTMTRSETTNVPLYYIYILKIIYIYIGFYILKTIKYIYGAHIGVDLGMSNMGDASCRHPNHSSRANISYTASVE